MSRSHHHPKLKPPSRPFFSCGIFRNCTQSVLSPTAPPASASSFLASPLTSTQTPTSAAPPLATSASSPPPSPKPSVASDSKRPTEPDRPPPSSSCSSSSSSSTSQSFTQWRFPLHHPHQEQKQQEPETEHRPPTTDHASASSFDLAEAFHAADLQFASGANVPALRLLERSLAPEPSPPAVPCPPGVMAGVVAALRDPVAARPAAKVLLALLLAEHNRLTAVEAGAASAAVEAVAESGPGGATAERALAALELLCIVPEGSAEVRGHPAAASALVGAVERMMGRGRECAIGVMAAIYGGSSGAAEAAPAEVGRAVVAAMQGECSARGRRKGAQLLRALQGSGRLDVATDGL